MENKVKVVCKFLFVLICCLTAYLVFKFNTEVKIIKNKSTNLYTVKNARYEMVFDDKNKALYFTPAKSGGTIKIDISECGRNFAANDKFNVHSHLIQYSDPGFTLNLIPRKDGVFIRTTSNAGDNNINVKISSGNLTPIRDDKGNWVFRNENNKGIVAVASYDIEKDGKILPDKVTSPETLYENVENEWEYKDTGGSSNARDKLLILKDISRKKSVTRVREVKSLSTESSKTYLMTDGSYQKVEHVEIDKNGKILPKYTYYKDQNGEYQDIEVKLIDDSVLASSNSFKKGKLSKPLSISSLPEVNKVKAKGLGTRSLSVKESSGEDSWQSLYTPLYARLYKNFSNGYTVRMGSSRLRFIPVGANSAVGHTQGLESNFINYHNAWPHTDVMLMMGANFLKENIIVFSSKAPKNFVFEVQGELTDKLVSGEIKIEQAFLIDSKGIKRNVAQDVYRQDGKTFLIIKPNFDGLTFPVTIDPTVTGGANIINQSNFSITLPDNATNILSTYSMQVIQFYSNDMAYEIKEAEMESPDLWIESNSYTHFDMWMLLGKVRNYWIRKIRLSVNGTAFIDLDNDDFKSGNELDESYGPLVGTYSGSFTGMRPGNNTFNGYYYAINYHDSIWPPDNTILVTITCDYSEAVLTGIQVEPPSITVTEGGTGQLSVKANYSDGSFQYVNSGVSWTSSNPGTASVNGSGLVTGVTQGSTSVSATYNGKSASASVTVLSSVPIGGGGSGNIKFTPSSSNWVNYNINVTASIDGDTTATKSQTVSWSWSEPQPDVCTTDDEGNEVCTPQPPIIHNGTSTYTQTWTIGPINVTGAASGVNSVTITEEGANLTLSGSATWNTSGGYWDSPPPPQAGVSTPILTPPPDYTGTSGVYKIDKTAPAMTVSYTATPGVWTNQNITISATASDNLSGFNGSSSITSYTSGTCWSPPFGLQGLPFGSTSFSFSRTVTSDSCFTVSAVLGDQAGNAGIINGAGGGSRTLGPFQLDKTSPTGSIQWVRDGFRAQHVSIIYNDPIANGVASGVAYMNILKPNGSWTGWRTVSSSAPDVVFANYTSNQTTSIQFQDLAGNYSGTSSDTRTIPLVTGTSLVGTGPGSPANRFLHTAPSFSWTIWTDTHNDPGNTQYGFQIPFSTRTGVDFYDTGFVITPTRSYTYPKATTPAAASAWWNSGTWQYKWRLKIWDLWGLENSGWYAGQDFDMIALERLRVSKIGAPPNGQFAPSLVDPATHIMIHYTTNPLPKIKANGMVVILFDAIGPVTSIPLGSNIYYANSTTGEKTTATVHNFTHLFPMGSPVNRFSMEVWSKPEVVVAGNATLINSMLEGVTGQGNNAHLRVATPYDISIAEIVGTAYTDWNVVLKGREN